MNACIRAVVRSCICHSLHVYGVKNGYEGLIAGRFNHLHSEDVSNIIHRGGTVLHASRSRKFLTVSGRKKASENLRDNKIDGLVVIGGDGSFKGADCISKEHGIRVVGIPATIDNDIWGSDYTIGYDTALNTCIQAIDRIKDTASAHDRLFIVEVMGRDAGFIALEAGVGVGAEAVLIPETQSNLTEIALKIQQRIKKGRTGNILVVAEGDEAGNAFEIAEKLEKTAGLKSHVTVLGHIQRGGSPTAADRVLASKLGWASVEALVEGAVPCMVGEINHRIVRHPLTDSWTNKKPLDSFLVTLSKILQ